MAERKGAGISFNPERRGLASVISGIGQHQLISAPSLRVCRHFSIIPPKGNGKFPESWQQNLSGLGPTLTLSGIGEVGCGRARAVRWARERTRTRGKEGKDARARPKDDVDDDDCGSVRSRWPAEFSGYRTWRHHLQ